MINVWSNEHCAVALYELRRLGLGMADKIVELAPGATGGDGVSAETRVKSSPVRIARGARQPERVRQFARFGEGGSEYRMNDFHTPARFRRMKAA